MEKPGSPQVPVGCKPLTTFVHTDTNSFREVVQRLTGPTEAQKDQSTPPINKSMGPKKPKLHERVRPKLEIVKPKPFQPNDHQISPFTSPIRTPSTILSTLTLKDGGESVKNSGPSPNLLGPIFNNTQEEEEEEKAIKERRFYLHPSPREREGYSEPQLLPLFPLDSPNTK